MSAVDLTGTKLAGALNWKGAIKSNFRGAVLKDVDLSGVDLSGVDLTGTKFAGVLNLKDAKLANLRGAVLNGADLRGVDLSGVDLSGADLRNADLTGVKGLQSIILGTGGKHTANVKGCKHGFRHRNFESAGTVVIVEGEELLAKATRYFNRRHPHFIFYTTSSGSESSSPTDSYVVPP